MYASAIYSGRANLMPIVISGSDPGGQLMITTDVENYPGFFKTIQGPSLMEEMKLQALKFGAEIIFSKIISVNFHERPFKLKSDSGILYIVDTLIISTGAQAKWLNIGSEIKYRGFGISSCATCDGFFFKDQTIAVIGGGNTAVEEALFLTKFAKKVFLIHRRNNLRSEKILECRLFNNSKIEIIWNNQVQDFFGDQNEEYLNGIKLQNVFTQEISRIYVTGVFVAIGHKPSTEVFALHLDMDKDGYIRVFPGTSHTSIPGIFVAGDVHDKRYRQAVTAAGFGCMAALDLERFLQ